MAEMDDDQPGPRPGTGESVAMDRDAIGATPGSRWSDPPVGNERQLCALR